MEVRSAAEILGITDGYIVVCQERRTAPQVNEIAARLGMSAGDFSNRFLKLVGERPSIYFRRARTECAKRLLSTTDLPIEEVALICGFGSWRTLDRSFAASVGTTPHEYRERNRR